MNKKKSLFIIDFGVLRDTFEGKGSAEECIDLLLRLKTKTEKMKAITTFSSLLRALWTMDKEKAKIKNIQLVVETVDIGFLSPEGFITFDYKNKEKVLQEMIHLATAFAEGKHKGE